MKLTRMMLFTILNIFLFSVAARAGNIINEGLFAEYNGVIYYSEQNDSGKLYAEYDNKKVKLSNLNAKYINIYGGSVYFCSTDEEGEYASISYYEIKSQKIRTIFTTEIANGIKNLYVSDKSAYFQSAGKIYSFNLHTHKESLALEDGEIANFIPMDEGFVYTKIQNEKTPLFIKTDKVIEVSEDITDFDVSNGKIYYSERIANALYSIDISGGEKKELCSQKLSNIIVDGNVVYGKSVNNYDVCMYDIQNGKLTFQKNNIYTFFNVINNKILSVYYSGEVLAKTVAEQSISARFSSFLPDMGTYKTWKQTDPRWAQVTFPNGETISKVGCLVTSISILLVGSGLKDESNFNPGVFVEALKNNNGFSGASLYWSAIERVVPEFKLYSSWVTLSGTKAQKAAIINSHVSQGKKVVVRAVTNQHWVAVDHVEGDNVYICDPARNVTELFSHYSENDVTRIAVFQPINVVTVVNKTGVYRITSDDGLRMRSGPGTDYERMGLIPFNTDVNITQVGDAWGYTSYNGVAGWVFLQYTSYLNPLNYTVTYDSNGGYGAPPPQTKTHNETLMLTMTRPIQPGYTFLGWSTDPLSSTPNYAPGSEYTANFDVTLYGIWTNGMVALQGDTDLDGKFDMSDIILAYQHVLNPLLYHLNTLNLNAADVNIDGVVDMQDILAMENKIASYK